MKDEINLGLTGIKFRHAYDKCIVLCVDVVIGLFETKETLLSALVVLLKKIMKIINFDVFGMESIGAVLIPIEGLCHH